MRCPAVQEQAPAEAEYWSHVQTAPPAVQLGYSLRASGQAREEASE